MSMPTVLPPELVFAARVLRKGPGFTLARRDVARTGDWGEHGDLFCRKTTAVRAA